VYDAWIIGLTAWLGNGPDMSNIRATLIDIYEHKAIGRYGLSDVNQLQHALQSAALAEKAGKPAAFVVAALLHDVGHMIHDLGEDPARAGVDDSHEERAALWLRQSFSAEVTEPIRLHVPAKRYLCAAESSYMAVLSEDSVRSLALQGGPMSAGEVSEFERNAHFQAAVDLRRIDDLAKDPSARTPPFAHFLPLIDALMAAN
jgi:[1-hydroxy-2-(trimethylamino)ethyl]phosphonate dioxygenase